MEVNSQSLSVEDPTVKNSNKLTVSLIKKTYVAGGGILLLYIGQFLYQAFLYYQFQFYEPVSKYGFPRYFRPNDTDHWLSALFRLEQTLLQLFIFLAIPIIIISIVVFILLRKGK